MHEQRRGTSVLCRAKTWYLKAVEQGHAFSQYSIGGLYTNGEHVPQDYVQAMDYSPRMPNMDMLGLSTVSAFSTTAAKVFLKVIHKQWSGISRQQMKGIVSHNTTPASSTSTVEVCPGTINKRCVGSSRPPSKRAHFTTTVKVFPRII